MTATGGKWGAGIGSGAWEDASDITIAGGNVTAIGGELSAGIGGGYFGVVEDITISGGTVNASGGSEGAGIGGGEYGEAYNICISGGTITAYSAREGAGIGGGGQADADGITISGGNITATGGRLGAGIGGGYNCDGLNIEITGGTVIANGGGYGAGIGGGDSGEAENITISGGTVTATGKWGGAGIGGGEYGNADNISITGGTVIAIGSDGAAGIGGGAAENAPYNGYGTNITIEGFAQVTAIGDGNGANAGDGANPRVDGKSPDNLTLNLDSNYEGPHSADHSTGCGRYNDIYGCELERPEGDDNENTGDNTGDNTDDSAGGNTGGDNDGADSGAAIPEPESETVGGFYYSCGRILNGHGANVQSLFDFDFYEWEETVENGNVVITAPEEDEVIITVWAMRYMMEVGIETISFNGTKLILKDAVADRTAGDTYTFTATAIELNGNPV